MRLIDKVAVITGGTRGLGRATAEAFLAEGANVVCAGRDEAAVKDLVDVPDSRAVFLPVDVTDAESVDQLTSATHERFGRLDVLVANAGVSRPSPIRALTAEQWTQTLETNLGGVFRCVRSVVPYMEKQGGGRIVTMSSAMSSRAFPGTSAYGASKAAIEQFTRVAAVELAGLGIRVNCVCPGVIDEGMGRQLAQHAEVWRQIQGLLAMGRPGEAREVAAAAVFLASDDSSYVNGHVLQVTGGLLW